VAEHGLRFVLEAYACQVLVDWREVVDSEVSPWTALADRLGGQGVASLDEAMLRLRLEPPHAALRALLDPALLDSLASGRDVTREERTTASAEAGGRLRLFLEGAATLARHSPDVTGGGLEGDIDCAVNAFRTRVDAAPRIAVLEGHFESTWTRRTRALVTGGRAALAGIVGWAALEALGRLRDPVSPGVAGGRLFEALRIRSVLADAATQAGLESDEAWRLAARVRVVLVHARSVPARVRTQVAPTLDWLSDPDAAWLTQVNEYEGVRYFVKEPFEELVWWMALPTLLTLAATPLPSADTIAALERDVAASMRAAAAAGYRVE
jgi:hypothetical protein